MRLNLQLIFQLCHIFRFVLQSLPGEGKFIINTCLYLHYPSVVALELSDLKELGAILF
ncbi:hypothetical protein KC19_2G172400 [Ceratodon purpureus]|uniref:Uncharacterized protein n=1 Tax=Ceratodon purpureus TaxID=3225 RepID=A0A8T0IX92_CERPU|nr:hypothetical protein KC19_2G172400 [Ceratodon purpureus]